MKRLALLLFLAIFVAFPLESQPPTQHGVSLTWTAPNPLYDPSNPGTGTLANYNVYRCSGTCTLTSGTFSIIASPSAITYFDPAAGLSKGSTYTYAVTTVDSLGNESVYSPLVVVVFNLVANPNAPGSLTGVVK